MPNAPCGLMKLYQFINGIGEPDYLKYTKYHEIVKSMKFLVWILSLNPKDVKDKGISVRTLYKIKP